MSEASYLLCNILGKQTDPDWRPDPVSLEMTAAVLAAAEERGRRRGIEERDELLRDIREGHWKARVRIGILLDRMRGCDDEIKQRRRDKDGHNLSVEFEGPSWLAEHDAQIARIDAALAPRDSGKELDAGGAVNETATKHAHDLFEKWPQLRDLSLNALTAELAAAEERGRRRGVEDLQTMLQNAAPHIIGAGHFRLWNCKCGYCAPLQAALAPRDSAPDPDPTCPEDFEPPWPRDSGKDFA